MNRGRCVHGGKTVSNPLKVLNDGEHVFMPASFRLVESVRSRLGRSASARCSALGSGFAVAPGALVPAQLGAAGGVAASSGH